MRDTVIGALAGGALLLTSSPASARNDDAGGFLLPGLLFAPGATRAVGAEVSYAHYPSGCCVGLGPRTSAEWLPPRGTFGGTYRGALGAQIFWAGFGVEASITRQGARDNGPRADYGAAIGAFASIGFASIGVRQSRSFGEGDATETSLVLTAKWVILAYGENPYESVGSGSNWGRMPSGRPLVVARSVGEAAHAVVAPLQRARSWAASDAPMPSPISAPLRDRLLALVS